MKHAVSLALDMTVLAVLATLCCQWSAMGLGLDVDAPGAPRATAPARIAPAAPVTFEWSAEVDLEPVDASA